MPELFGQSFGDFTDRVGGLLDTENPQNLGSLAGNPMFNMGMGILSANQDPNQNVFQGAMTGLGTAKKQMQTDEDRARIAKLREELAKLLGQQPGQGAPPGGTPPIMPPGMPGAPQGGLPGQPPGMPGAQPGARDPITEQMIRRMQLQDIVGRQHG